MEGVVTGVPLTLKVAVSESVSRYVVSPGYVEPVTVAVLVRVPVVGPTRRVTCAVAVAPGARSSAEPSPSRSARPDRCTRKSSLGSPGVWLSSVIGLTSYRFAPGALMTSLGLVTTKQ